MGYFLKWDSISFVGHVDFQVLIPIAMKYNDNRITENVI